MKSKFNIIFKVAFSLIFFFLIRNLPAQDLGANFNENIDKATIELVSKSKVKWIRGFVNVPVYCLNLSSSGTVTGVNDYGIHTLSGISNLISAKSVTINVIPVKLIFSLKLAFTTKNMGVPSVNTSEMNYVLLAVEKLLLEKNFGASIDVLVVGNEPMWETPTADADKYEAFLNLLIDRVDSLRNVTPGWKYEIYAGSLNKSNSNKSNAILQKVLKIAKENTKVVGLDMHEHVTNISEAEDDIKYIRTNQGFNKKMMCTEFSLVWLWNAHASDALGIWGLNNGYSSSTKMYEWLNLLMQKSYAKTQVTPDHFLSYFNSTSWYPKNWFSTFYNIFKKYNLSIVTYGIQNIPTTNLLTSTSDLWTVNFVYNGTYLGLDTDFLGNTNPLVYPNFKAITDSLNSTNTDNKKLKYSTSSLKISPNPASTFINISIDEPPLLINLSIYDMNSKKVFSKSDINLPTQINLSKNNLKNGIYLVDIEDKYGFTNNKIVIKNL